MFVLYSQNYAARAQPIPFNTPKKSLLKSSYSKKYLPNFRTQKIPEPKISNPKKSFDHPRHLKSRGPPLGTRHSITRYHKASHSIKRHHTASEGLTQHDKASHSFTRHHCITRPYTASQGLTQLHNASHCISSPHTASEGLTVHCITRHHDHTAS